MKTTIEVGDVVDYRPGSVSLLTGGSVQDIYCEDGIADAWVQFGRRYFWTSIDNLVLSESAEESPRVQRWLDALDRADMEED